VYTASSSLPSGDLVKRKIEEWENKLDQKLKKSMQTEVLVEDREIAYWWEKT
jgi:hypothetical protein